MLDWHIWTDISTDISVEHRSICQSTYWPICRSTYGGVHKLHMIQCFYILKSYSPFFSFLWWSSVTLEKKKENEVCLRKSVIFRSFKFSIQIALQRSISLSKKWNLRNWEQLWCHHCHLALQVVYTIIVCVDYCSPLSKHVVVWCILCGLNLSLVKCFFKWFQFYLPLFQIMVMNTWRKRKLKLNQF